MTTTKWVGMLAIVLMLLSMFVYVLSDDEAIQPDDASPEQGVPAAAE